MIAEAGGFDQVEVKRSEQTRLGKRKMPAHTHDDVIEHWDLQAAQGVLEGLGHLPVGSARRGDPGGMIVRQDHARRVAGQGPASHLAGIDRGLAESAHEELLEQEQPVAAV